MQTLVRAQENLNQAHIVLEGIRAHSPSPENLARAIKMYCDRLDAVWQAQLIAGVVVQL